GQDRKMRLATTGPLRREIVRRFPERPFAIEFWDGTAVPPTRDGGPTFKVRSPSAVAYALRAPGQLGLGRAYVSGGLDVDDLDGASLESAQEAKLELTCRKLGLAQGQRVLDVGCGWGAFAIHAAARYGVEVVGITLSEPQAALARARVREAGLEERVSIRVLD